MNNHDLDWKEKHEAERSYRNAYWKRHRLVKLSTYAMGFLLRLKIEATPKDVKRAIKGGALTTGKESARGYGPKTHNELRVFAGMEKEERKNRWKFDPYTGKPIPPKE
jgi:hypothetical protein